MNLVDGRKSKRMPILKTGLRNDGFRSWFPHDNPSAEATQRETGGLSPAIVT